MRRKFILTTALVAVTAVAASSVPAGAAPTAGSAALREFEGTVVSKNGARARSGFATASAARSASA